MNRYVMIAGAAAAALALSGCNRQAATSAANTTATNTTMGETAGTAPSASAANDAQGQVNDSATVLAKMSQDPSIKTALAKAQGVFIIPDYGKGGLVVGAKGGEGVLMVRNGATWSDPVFYNTGGVTLGAQAGGEGGAIALLLMTPKAVKSVREADNWSLNANAGLTVVTATAASTAKSGVPDVIEWSDMGGAFAGATIGVSDIAVDQQQTMAYYPGLQSVDQVFSGQTRNPAAQSLVAAMPGGSAKG